MKRWTLIGGAAVSGLLIGLVVFGGRDALDASTDHETPPDESIEMVADLRSAEELVHAIEWAADGRLWYVGSTATGEHRLYGVDSAGGAASWPLPGDGAPGPHTFLTENPDGSWWIAAGYTIWRFDAAGGYASLVASLPNEDDLQTEDALDRGNLPGTWVTSFISSEGRGVFTRNNVRGGLLYRRGWADDCRSNRRSP